MNNIEWFNDEESSFLIGIELYNDSIVEEKNDMRKFIKIHFGTLNNIKCQTFYRSSGINSLHTGRWYPTNSVSIRTEYEATDRSFKNFWYITKKPWLITPENRFGENIEVEFVSHLLGGEPYIGDNLTFNQFYNNNSRVIHEFLMSLPVVKLSNYQINQWIDDCISYKWHKPYYEAFPDFVPDLNPTTSNLWMKNKDGKLVLPSMLFTKPKLGHELHSLKVLEQNNYENLSRMEKMKKMLRLKALRRQLIKQGTYPDSLIENVKRKTPPKSKRSPQKSKRSPPKSKRKTPQKKSKRSPQKSKRKTPQKKSKRSPQKSKRSKTVAEKRKNCKEKGLVYDVKTKRCRKSRR